jgi:hypothetical protein
MVLIRFESSAVEEAFEDTLGSDTPCWRQEDKRIQQTLHISDPAISDWWKDNMAKGYYRPWAECKPDSLKAV